MTDLITLAEYKTFKGITSDTQDTVISAIIPTTTALIESYCGRVFRTAAGLPATIEFFDAYANEVQMEGFPLISVDYVGTSEDGGLTYVQLVEDAVDKSGYFVDNTDSNYSRVRMQRPTSKFLTTYDTPYKSLVVHYLYGYSAANMPEDLKLAAYSLVEYYLEEQYTPGKALAGASLDNPITLSSDFPPHIRRILDLYRVGA